MTTLATLADSNLDPQTAFTQLKAVEQIIETIDTADLLVEVMDRAKMAQAYLKVKKAASDVMIQACRVQLAALRRIGQLGEQAVAQIPDPKEQKFALKLAALTDARFTGELDALDSPTSAGSFLSHINWIQQWAIWMNRGVDAASGKLPRTADQWDALAREQMRKEESERPLTPRQQKQKEEMAAWLREREQRESRDRAHRLSELLGDTYENGDPFCISDAAQTILDELGEKYIDHYGDPKGSGTYTNSGSRDDLVAGVQIAVEGLLKTAVADDAGGYGSVFIPELGVDVHLPEFITYHNRDAGWIRIPSHAATIVQLLEMAAMRRQQVAELARKAEELTALAEALDREHVKSGKDNLGVLMRLAQMRSGASKGGRKSAETRLKKMA